MHLPIPALLQRLKINVPSVIGIVLLIALSIAMAWQSAELLRLVRSPATAPANSAASNLVQASHAPIAQLFGTPAQSESGPPPPTNLQLTLLGSFVHSDPQRSSALIQRQGQPAQRYSVGGEVDSGVRLDAVHADRVELLRNGRRESLTFPQPSSNQYSAYIPPVEQSENTLDQLDQLQQDDMQQLQERMQALREQMEAAGTLQPEDPTDQPQESD